MIMISKDDLFQELEPMLTWEMIAAINKLPMVQVVRCKDCAFHVGVTVKDDKIMHICSLHKAYTTEDFFCDNGNERMKEEGT